MYPSSPDIRKLHDNGEGMSLDIWIYLKVALLIGSVYTAVLPPADEFDAILDPLGDFLFGGPGYILNSKAVIVCVMFPLNLLDRFLLSNYQIVLIVILFIWLVKAMIVNIMINQLIEHFMILIVDQRCIVLPKMCTFPIVYSILYVIMMMVIVFVMILLIPIPSEYILRILRMLLRGLQ